MPFDYSAFRADFFVLRTPLLPLDSCVSSDAPNSQHPVVDSPAQYGSEQLDEQFAMARAKLNSLVQRPVVRRALEFAAPSLIDGLRYWPNSESPRKSSRTERSLTRYIQRLCSRSTPFGLMAGCSLGTIAREMKESTFLLEGEDAYRCSTQLDFDYVFLLVSHLLDIQEVRHGLVYERNSTLHRINDFWHYIECRTKEGNRVHHVCRVDSVHYLDALLERTNGRGAPFSALCDDLVATMSDVHLSKADASEYLDELVTSGILVPTLVPPATCNDIIEHLMTNLEGVEGATPVRSALERVRVLCNFIDSAPIGDLDKQRREIQLILESIGVPFNPGKMIQTDLYKPAQNVCLGKDIYTHVLSVAHVLAMLNPRHELEVLPEFRNAFTARYGESWVPVAEALDEDNGIGFDPQLSSDGSAVLRELTLGRDQQDEGGRFTSFTRTLLTKVMEASTAEVKEITLKQSDFPFPDAADSALPASFEIMFSVASRPSLRSRESEYDLVLKSANGPSGARILGRFAHAVPGLTPQIKDFLKKEEALLPEAIFAEIVHLPQGRLGNVIKRPSLRDHEISYLGRSSAPDGCRIGIDDLLVTVRGNDIILLSKAKGRRIIPRMTNAHTFYNKRLNPIYRFLGYLQHQGGNSISIFDWGLLSVLPFLPRVRYGNIILTLARWRISEEEASVLWDDEPSVRYSNVQIIRQRRRLPRLLSLVDEDTQMLIDLDNPLSVLSFVDELWQKKGGVLEERYPDRDHLSVEGPEGRFESEFVVPLYRTQISAHRGREANLDHRKELLSPLDRIAPGGEWQYVKLYGGSANLDRITATSLPKILSKVKETMPRLEWFFLRYSDPEPHLRVRFKMSLLDFHNLVLPEFTRSIEAGYLWKLQLDTYDRETHRYGGPAGMILAEKIFTADSEAVVSILEILGHDEGLENRWRAAVVGMDAYLGQFLSSPQERLLFSQTYRNTFVDEFALNSQGKTALNRKVRQQYLEVSDLESLVASDPLMASVKAIYTCRQKAIEPHFDALTKLAAANQLLSSTPDLLASFAHLFINRLCRSQPRVHELVCYSVLTRIYERQIRRDT